MDHEENNELDVTNTDENVEFEERPAGNKDLWLFLIVLDVIVLCVFGFFIYKHFASQVFEVKPDAQTEITVAEEPAELVVVEKETVAAATPVAEKIAKPEPIKQEPAKPAPAKPASTVLANIKIEPATPAPAPVVTTEETQPIVSVAQNPETLEMKESIFVEPSKGKYRQVTFRWFGEGKKVEIVSGFTMAKPRALKKVGDHWEITLGIGPGTYKFLYIIDGHKTQDPYAPEEDGRSVVTVK